MTMATGPRGRRPAVAVRNASERDGVVTLDAAGVRNAKRHRLSPATAAGYPDAVRWLVLVGSMAGVVACTAVNPAYETTGETHDGNPSEGDVETLGPGGTLGGSTRGETTDEPGPDATSEGGSSTGGGSLPLPDPLCRFDLYAINDAGELHVLDPDEGDSMLRLEDSRLVSWAIATDPATGLLYVNQRDSPSSILRVDPFVPEIHADPIVVEAEMLDTVARATFRGPGELWLGTDQTHRFVWVPPTGGTLGADETFDPFPKGGDLLFLAESCAVVATLDGTFFEACFPAVPGRVPMLPVVDLPAGPQFTGIAIDERDRLWLSTSDPSRLVVRIDMAQEPWRAVEEIPYGITMNDLATVIHPSGC
jgi:hypothetical protein